MQSLKTTKDFAATPCSQVGISPKKVELELAHTANYLVVKDMTFTHVLVPAAVQYTANIYSAVVVQCFPFIVLFPTVYIVNCTLFLYK